MRLLALAAQFKAGWIIQSSIYEGCVLSPTEGKVCQEFPIFMGLETGGQPPSNFSEILH